MNIQIEPFFDTRTSTVSYVVWDPETRDAVVIDPVLDYEPVGSFTYTESANKIIHFVTDKKLKVHYVLETHAHADHLSAAQLLRRCFDARVVIGERIRLVQETFKELFALGDRFATDGSQFDRLVADGELLRAGSLAIGVLNTPGHTPACVSYLVGDAVFTGDALFMDDYGTGRCDFPKGSADAMFDSIQRLYQLPDETRVFVGHDYRPGGRPARWETTIAASKRNNPQLNSQTTREQFVRLRERRDATLASPVLLFQSVQVNIAGGKLPPAQANGKRYLTLPLNLLHPADELGQPLTP